MKLVVDIPIENYNSIVFDDAGIGRLRQIIKEGTPFEEVFDDEIKALEFTKWVAKEIFDEEWEFNKDSFEEAACRKLEKLGLVRKTDNNWILAESEE